MPCSRKLRKTSRYALLLLIFGVSVQFLHANVRGRSEIHTHRTPSHARRILSNRNASDSASDETVLDVIQEKITVDTPIAIGHYLKDIYGKIQNFSKHQNFTGIREELTYFNKRTWNKFLFANRSIPIRGFEPKMTSAEKRVFYETLQQLNFACKRVNADCFMYGGTLLGSWRHHDVIPWDGDGDVMVGEQYKEDLYVSLSMSSHFRVHNSGTRFKFFSKHASHPTHHPWGWPYVDVWFYRENSTHIWDTAGSRAFQREYVYPKEIIFPLHPRPIGNTFFSSPHDGLATLQITYKTTDCETYFYDHKSESETRDVYTTPCSVFKNHVPFVFRTAASDSEGVVETVVLGKRILRMILVQEPKQSLSYPYNLTKQRG